jgi:uncharacterized membrane protein YhaH (DUF805 family)
MAHISAAQPVSEGFFAHLFNPTGRTNRAKWWLSILIYALVYGAAFALLYTVTAQGLAAGDPAQGTGMLLLATAIFGVVAVVVVVSSILIAIRRLHDRDKSGHWLWLLYVLPSVLSVVAQVLVGVPGLEFLVAGGVLALGSLGLTIWAIVELGCLRGTPGPNRFGPDPLQA